MSATAEIIPFPARVHAGCARAVRPCVARMDVVPTAGAPPPDGVERLRRALAMLDAALAEQRAAVETWRDGLIVLRGSVTRLGGSLRAYRDQLSGLRGRTEDAHAEALRLEAWADAALLGPTRPDHTPLDLTPLD
ncbi:MAG: hypothetical protein ACREFY_07295 [Acetobacteraceae bacterium]